MVTGFAVPGLDLAVYFLALYCLYISSLVEIGRKKHWDSAA